MTLHYYLDVFIHVFYVLRFFVLVKSFSRKNRMCKTSLMTLFILLLEDKVFSQSKFLAMFFPKPANLLMSSK